MAASRRMDEGEEEAMNADESAAAVAALDQSKAAVEDMADHIGAFYARLTHSMSEDHALDLTSLLLVSMVASNQDD